MTLVISKTTKTYPRLPYETIKNTILGDQYQLSLVFIGDRRARQLNQDTRNKNYAPNVLSFPLGNTAGEIYIAPRVALKEAPDFDLSPRGYIGFLFIHGCLHLKGLDHGAEMERHEATLLKKFNLS